MEKYDVFISFKSEDAPLARSVHEYLAAKGLQVFCSDISLEQHGVANFRAAIDHALESSRLLIVVASLAENLKSKWVEYEWSTFHNEIISDRKPGGRLFVYVDGISAGALPLALRQSQIIEHDSNSLEQLYGFVAAALGEKRAPPAGDKTKRPKKAEADAAELLRLLLRGKGGNVAEAPANLQQAITRGLAEVDRVLLALGSQQRRIELGDIEAVVSLAISHGAGIYNHSDAGKVGCAKIYHRAASGLIGCATNTSFDARRPAAGTDLAIRWLNRIVSAHPLVRNHQADDLAWELRFAFDAMPVIPELDNACDVLAAAVQQDKAGVLVADVLRRVLDFARRISATHVRAFCLCQIAAVLALQIKQHRRTGRHWEAVEASLTEVTLNNDRINRANHSIVVVQLGKELESAMATLQSGGDEQRGWFGRWWGGK